MSDIGDQILARLLQDNADEEARVEHFHGVGRILGAVHDGMRREGVDTEAATEMTIEWMECHLFDRIERFSGQPVTDEDLDEDAVDPDDDPDTDPEKYA